MRRSSEKLRKIGGNNTAHCDKGAHDHGHCEDVKKSV